VAAVLGDPARDADGVIRFNTEHGDRAQVEVVELKVGSAADIERAGSLVPAGIPAYLEVAAGPGAPALLERIAAAGGRAKFRTGGTVAEAFPAPDALLAMLGEAELLGLSWKATAGLHHALRGSYALTYEPGAARATMFGFLNLLLAAACLARGAVREAPEALVEARPAALRLEGDVLLWRTLRFTAAELAELRRNRFRGFGSCSFREPLDELAGYGWI
jgi:hypothetical protein